MVAVVLAEEPCRLRGVPEISDVQIVAGLLELHGVKIDSSDRDGELLLDPTNVEQAHVADIDAHAGSSRVPVLLCGPCSTGSGRRSSRTWVVVGSASVRSTSTWTSCAPSVPSSTSVPRGCA